MEKRNYGVLDIAKFISALLVIAIHCAPFYQVNETWNFVYVQIIARLAVPFFFMASGWLFFQKLDIQKGAKDEGNLHVLKRYWLRILKLYLVWSALYLPLLIASWIKGGFGFSACIRFLRDFLFNGTFYHLWFLPALLLGILIVYILIMKYKRRSALCICFILYMLGMLINVYGSELINVPLLNSLLSLYESVLVTARNGIFFAPLYLLLGFFAQDFINNKFKKQALGAFLISFIALCAEAFLYRYLHMMNDLTSMYFCLVPTVFFLFIYLLQLSFNGNVITLYLRKLSLLIYVSHIYFITLFMNVLKLSNLTVYLLTIVCSCAFSWCIIVLSDRYPRLKVMM